MVQLSDSKAWTLYSSAAGLVNDRMETMRGFSKVQTALDIRLQYIVRKSGPFVKEPNNIAKKKRSKGSGRKTQGLPPRNPLPLVQHQAASTSGPAAKGCRRLQNSKSGSGKHPKSSKKEKHRINPSSTPAHKDCEVQTAERHQQTSQAKSKGSKTRDQGGIGCSGSSQSSSCHGGTHQGQEFSTNSGRPRPAPLAATPKIPGSICPRASTWRLSWPTWPALQAAGWSELGCGQKGGILFLLGVFIISFVILPQCLLRDSFKQENSFPKNFAYQGKLLEINFSAIICYLLEFLQNVFMEGQIIF